MQVRGFEDLGQVIGPVIAIVVFMLLNILLKGRRAERTPAEIAMSLLSDVMYNQRLVESLRLKTQARKFKTGSWKRNQTRLSFLDTNLQATLTQSFGIAEEFNRDIDSARKYRSSSYVANIDAGRLSKPLADSRQGLEEWLRTNISSKDAPRRRGMFG